MARKPSWIRPLSRPRAGRPGSTPCPRGCLRGAIRPAPGPKSGFGPVLYLPECGFAGELTTLHFRKLLFHGLGSISLRDQDPERKGDTQDSPLPAGDPHALLTDGHGDTRLRRCMPQPRVLATGRTTVAPTESQCIANGSAVVAIGVGHTGSVAATEPAEICPSLFLDLLTEARLHAEVRRGVFSNSA